MISAFSEIRDSWGRKERAAF